jgi:nickel-dependent lactate racemase
MNIEISYGSGKIGFDIPEKNLAGIIRPRKTAVSFTQIQIETAISANRDFADSLKDKKLCILVPDGTRDLPTDKILIALAPLLSRPADIIFIICTGTHNAKTERNSQLISRIESIMRKTGVKNFDIIVHDCEKANFLDAGTTSRQTPVLYNAAIKDADIFLAISDVKHHYFAGYSNPVKNFVPGICAYKTAQHNHSFALDPYSRFGAHPWHTRKDLRDNPLAADQVEAMEKIVGQRPFWAVGMISSQNQIQWLGFGKAKDISAQAFEQADEWNIYEVEPVEKMVVSCGGSPNDIDLYIAQRALELTKQAVLDGGEILFAAECEKGIGAQRTMEHFWNLLTRPFDTIFETVKNQPYKLFSHKPLRFAELICRLRNLWVYSKLPDEMIKAAHMNPAANIQDIINKWTAENPAVKILVVDEANKLAIRARTDNRQDLSN